MKPHGGGAHPAMLRLPLLAAPGAIAPAQPVLIQLRRQERIIIPREALHCHLPSPAKDAQRATTALASRSRVEDLGERVIGPVAVEEDGMGGIDGFEAVVERGGERPHLGRHVVAAEVFSVHEVEQTLADAELADDGGAARRARLLVIAPQPVAEDPVRLDRVE